MVYYASLHELITKDVQSKELFDRLSKEVQVELQEQRQDVCSYDELAKVVGGLQKRSQS